MHRVGLFVTCLADGLRPQIGVAAYRLLRAAGADVVYPETQTCCGQIAFNSGYQEPARALAEKCADEFHDCDYVVMPSGSCCGMFRTHLSELFGDNSVRINHFSRKCLELSEYLQQVNYVPAAKNAITVTYHDSCAGLRELGVKQTPRRLLRDSGAVVVEMPDCEECCGFGGRFADKFGELSTAMATRKCDNIASVKSADAVVGGDLGCLLHIEGRLRRQGSELPVMHWAEVLTR